MTERTATLLLAAVTVGLPLLGAAAAGAARGVPQSNRLAAGFGVATAVAAGALAAVALIRSGAPVRSGLCAVDGASGVFVAVTALVGLLSVIVSPAQLRFSRRSWLRATDSHRWYYAVLFTFWAALLAVPLAGNLAIAWLLIEGTTAASALLVSFSGRPAAIEASWKYLVLTTLGLAAAMLGIVVLAVAQSGAGHDTFDALQWSAISAAAPHIAHPVAVFAFVLIIGGLAAKIGWAPVHNWLPDAHSEGPAPVSALLSAVLLPTVVLIAWRVREALVPAIGSGTASGLFLAFGLASILIAVPFLWRPLPWKRLLAYSSLEHMGIVALGIGFGTPLAIAGVVLHVAGHALAKSLGFYTALPLLRLDRHAGSAPLSGVVRLSPRTAAGMATSLTLLAGVPPSPLFVSELLIVAGGFAAGDGAVTAIAIVALALAFLGLLHALVEGVVGDGTGGRSQRRRSRTEQRIVTLTAVVLAASVVLAVVGATALPGSALVTNLMRGVP